MATSNNLVDFLTSIANAIRNKKGTTGSINAQNFASEIESIESGGSNALFKVVDRSVTELTSKDLENVTSIGNYAFYGCTSLTSIEIPIGASHIFLAAF